MKTTELPNEALLPALSEIINVLTSRYTDAQVEQLLSYLAWTILKRYDSEEQADAIIDYCKEWLLNPNSFNNS